MRSWTIYEAEGYPHRIFQLRVVAHVVAQVAYGQENTTPVVVHCPCDRRSVGRWIKWVARLADLENLAKACARLDPDGSPAPTPPKEDAPPAIRAGKALHLLDHLATLFRRNGVDLGKDGPGLLTILRHQWSRFRDVFFLTRPSPPLLISLGELLR